jgi:hypothetical protein
MRTLRLLVSSVLLFIVVFAGAWFAWQGVTALGGWLQAAHLEGPFVQALLLAIFGFLGIVYGKISERRTDLELRLHEKKVEVYDQFMTVLFGLVNQSRTQEGGDNLKTSVDISPETQASLQALARQLTLWGSNGMIREFGVFSRIARTYPAAGVFQLEAILLQMRRDLGHSRLGIGDRDLLRLFVNDIDDIPYVSPKGALRQLEAQKRTPDGEAR